MQNTHVLNATLFEINMQKISGKKKSSYWENIYIFVIRLVINCDMVMNCDTYGIGKKIFLPWKSLTTLCLILPVIDKI